MPVQPFHAPLGIDGKDRIAGILDDRVDPLQLFPFLSRQLDDAGRPFKGLGDGLFRIQKDGLSPQSPRFIANRAGTDEGSDSPLKPSFDFLHRLPLVTVGIVMYSKGKQVVERGVFFEKCAHIAS